MSDRYEALIRDCIAKEEELIRSAQQHIEEMKAELKAAGKE